MRTRWTELRTWAASVDPGLTRLHLASVATASMIVAAGLMSVLRTATGQPVTVVLFAVVLAMISNLAVNEPQLRRRRVTTALMVLPAAGAATVATLLSSSQRIVADVVFVLVMIVAVAIRRYGPRGMALGMAAFMPYFFVLFLQAGVSELPFLLAGVLIGIGTTFVLRCLVFTAPPERVVDRLVRAFEARLHGLTLAVLEVLESGEPSPSLDETREQQARLNETALLVADRLDDIDADGKPQRPGRTRPGERAPGRPGCGSGSWTRSWPASGWPWPPGGWSPTATRPPRTTGRRWPTGSVRSSPRPRSGRRTRWRRASTTRRARPWTGWSGSRALWTPRPACSASRSP